MNIYNKLLYWISSIIQSLCNFQSRDPHNWPSQEGCPISHASRWHRVHEPRRKVGWETRKPHLARRYRRTYVTNLKRPMISVESKRCLAVPPPSTDDKAWWDSPGELLSEIPSNLRKKLKMFSETPAGVISLTDIQKLDLYKRKNPFESPYASPLSSSPSSSDEELYSHALTLHAPMAPVQTSTRRPAPAPPPRSSKSADAQETHGWWLRGINSCIHTVDRKTVSQDKEKDGYIKRTWIGYISPCFLRSS